MSEEPRREEHHHHAHIEEHLQGSLIASVALLLALGIHSIIAGFSMGLDDTQSAESTAIALCAHKAFAGYALGSTLTASGQISTSRFFIMVFMFAMSTPFGVFIALGISNLGVDVDGTAISCLKAAVAGTFMYIAIIEVGMKELLVCRIQAGASVLGVGKRLEIGKLSSFVVGYLAMSYLALYI